MVKHLLLTAQTDILESLRAKWFLAYSLIFGGLVALLFVFGLTESRIMGFTGLSRLMVTYIQLAMAILPLFVLITTVRSALVDFFREQGRIMIATGAGAEGINLQFCSLGVNYDLPWNPQRIEQRIGRCHRYGQKHDVVMVNFLNSDNEADRRVYELLDQKFSLFEGVFGASDEVLGSIESGVDFEKRINDIYQRCREPEEIWLRGRGGALLLEQLTVESLDQTEDCLGFACRTWDGEQLDENQLHRLLGLPAMVEGDGLTGHPDPDVWVDFDKVIDQRIDEVRGEISRGNADFFEAEAAKLDAWADDLKVGLERDIRDLDRQIKEARRATTAAPTLEEKLHAQKQIRALESLRGQKRRALFDAQDDVDSKRDQLIDDMAAKLEQRETRAELFRVLWAVR